MGPLVLHVTCLSTGPPRARPVHSAPMHRTPAGTEWDHVAMPETPRFLTLADVAEVLNTSSAQVYALVRRGELPAIKLGGRGQWRIEASKLEEFINGLYKETEQFVSEHPFVDSETEG